MNIAVFVSGNGSNLQVMIDAERKGSLADGRIALVVSSRADAYALQRAEQAGIKTFVLEDKDSSSREDYDKKVLDQLRQEKIETVVLAGFMRILSRVIIEPYSNKILNVHPALLPEFKGAHGIRDAFQARRKKTGVTIHFVTEELDEGPIIMQKEVLIDEKDTLESLEEKIHEVEHEIYPEAVRLFAEGKIFVKNGAVIIKE
ncbi:MAG: phosphoribosylglycinamide formyltransferase [Candidatus Aadella gelida]|nr:phosphoribosylglycinamide formyltransferase [Candidatus Aadella gelida]